ncbi:hypothetical protein FHS76_003329 [Ochrobactrum daejeonense]|uniref:Uncharacterized protein n=1 Tax=Brucella daejeonensis TaxID=659015 RepID=A0A7W9EP58_9HYPH|nr:hypothetical protein [Brucella daejeonensis]
MAEITADFRWHRYFTVASAEAGLIEIRKLVWSKKLAFDGVDTAQIDGKFVGAGLQPVPAIS